MRFSRRLLLVLGAAGTFVLTLVGQSVRVLSVSGEATLQGPEDAAPRVLRVGDSIVVGTRIVTGEGGRVILTPLPGVRSIIAPGSDLVIERVSSTPAPGSAVALQQATLDLRTGAITSDLERTEGVALDYQIRTARGVAGARGTTYTVAVDLAGLASIVVTQGSISLTLTDGRVIELSVGQISVTRPDGAIRTVARASDLDAADQAAAAEAVATTLEALAEAIEQGVALQPEALENALRVADELGIELDSLTRDAVDRARRILAERTLQEVLADAGAGAAFLGARGAEASEIVTQETVFEETDDGEDPEPELGFLDRLSPARRAVYDALSARQKVAFGLLSSDELRLLVLDVNEAVFSEYALALTEGGTLVRSADSIRYAGTLTTARRQVFVERSSDVQDLLVDHPADLEFAAFALDDLGGDTADATVLFYFYLESLQRAAFLDLPLALRSRLVRENDSALTEFVLRPGITTEQVDFVLNLDTAERRSFFSFAYEIQFFLLANLGDQDLIDFSLSHNDSSFAVISFYAAMDSEERHRFRYEFSSFLRERIVEDSLLAALAFEGGGNGWTNSVAVLEHYVDLAGVGTFGFFERPADIRELLAEYGRPGFTQAVLDPESFPEKLTPTDDRLRGALTALNGLSIENQDLFQELAGGPGFHLLASAPAPDQWSNAAFSRSGNSWRSLGAGQRSQLLGLGATSALMNRSGTYLEEALADFNQLDVATRNAIAEAGWGRDFAAYFTSEEIRGVFAEAGELTSNEIQALRQLNLSAYAFLEASDFYYEDLGIPPAAAAKSPSPTSDGNRAAVLAPVFTTPRERLSALAALPAEDRALLAGLNLGDGLLQISYRENPYNGGGVLQTYSQIIGSTLAFARELSEVQRQALREMGTTEWLYLFQPGDELAYNSTTLTALQVVQVKIAEYLALDLARRAAARDTALFQELSFFYGSTAPQNDYADFLDAWLVLPKRIQAYLIAEGEGLSYLEIFRSGGGESSYRSWSQFIALLSGLEEGQLSLLSDLDASEALALNSVLPGNPSDAMTALRDLLVYVEQLGDPQAFALTELGIVGAPGLDGEQRHGLFYANRVGLARLLGEYSQLDEAIRVDTRQINPDRSYRDFVGNNFFFAADDGGRHTTYNVTFKASGDLRVGATRRLALYRDGYNYGGSENPAAITFDVPSGADLHLRASDLIDLEGVTVSSGVRAITMAAVTINLANFNFPEGSRAALTSRDGGVNFGSSEVGKINLIYGVSYGGRGMFDQASLQSASNGNVVFGSFANPAVLPSNYTPPSTLPPPSK